MAPLTLTHTKVSPIPSSDCFHSLFSALIASSFPVKPGTQQDSFRKGTHNGCRTNSRRSQSKNQTAKDS